MKSENKMDSPSETQALPMVVGALRILGFFSVLGAFAATIGESKGIKVSVNNSRQQWKELLF